jgi:predicted flavoprotein YhiN
VLQVSSYWTPGEAVVIDLLPGRDVADWLARAQRENGAQELKTLLARELPRRLVEKLIEQGVLLNKPLRQYTPRELAEAGRTADALDAEAEWD